MLKPNAWIKRFDRVVFWVIYPFKCHPKKPGWAQQMRNDAKAYPEARREWENQQAAKAEQDRREGVR